MTALATTAALPALPARRRYCPPTGIPLPCTSRASPKGRAASATVIVAI